jgi:ferritin-like metal-binding protein YciE
MAKAASAPELRQAFESHLEETKGHVQRLETIFRGLDHSPKGKKCKAMAGLIEEGGEILKEDGQAPVVDAALIAAAQRVEHYEMAAYGSARTFATLLGFEDAVKLLQQTLDEEVKADKKLTEVAETEVNPEARSLDGEENAATEKDEEMATTNANNR